MNDLFLLYKIALSWERPLTFSSTSNGMAALQQVSQLKVFDLAKNHRIVVVVAKLTKLSFPGGHA